MSSIWDIINIPLGWIIKISYSLTHNYAVALFLFALILQIILFPLGIKQQKNSVKQASLRPKEMAIRKKYAGRTDKPTQQKLNQEIMELYQRENLNPVGGCPAAADTAADSVLAVQRRSQPAEIHLRLLG